MFNGYNLHPQQTLMFSWNDLKKNIYQHIVFLIKTTCSDTNRIQKKQCVILKQTLMERGYEENIFKGKVDKVDNTDRKDLLRKKEKSNKNRILCLIAYNRKLPMFCKIINKCWNAL